MVIKNKDFEIAEDPEEALWIRCRDATQQRITDMENALIIEREILKVAKTKIKDNEVKDEKEHIVKT